MLVYTDAVSWRPCDSPDCAEDSANDVIRLVIEPKAKDIGAFEVRRCLPVAACRSVGPFVFFDEMGPASMAPGPGMSVRPHPHVNLATITYLFDGQIMHRDSLANALPIEPGAVNLMVAGRGIVHSERTPETLVDIEKSLHGLQLWIALPESEEERDPSFEHHPAETIPEWTDGDVLRRLVMGEVSGHVSPVSTYSPTLYEIYQFQPGGELELPEASERAIYAVDHPAELGAATLVERTMAVLQPGRIRMRAPRGGRFALIAGDSLGTRFMEWNFVSSRRERIAQAKEDWRNRRFPLVPGDETERIPFPGDPE